jgi:hypothetical protein
MAGGAGRHKCQGGRVRGGQIHCKALDPGKEAKVVLQEPGAWSRITQSPCQMLFVPTQVIHVIDLMAN